MMRLTEIEPQKVYFVKDVTAEPLLRERLLELGLAPGRSLQVFINNLPLSGPIVVLAGSLAVALRRSEAECVWVE